MSSPRGPVSAAYLDRLGARLACAYATDITATRDALGRARAGDTEPMSQHWFIAEAAPDAPAADQTRLLNQYLGAVEHLASADGYHPHDDALTGGPAAARDQARAAAVHRQLDGADPNAGAAQHSCGARLDDVLGATDPIDVARTSVVAAEQATAQLDQLLRLAVDEGAGTTDDDTDGGSR
ncbi:hypothetical protein [Pseudonocardia humida]|uniref:DUF305 family protein family protein n=1 Tax=Pseudonocardia humida TaxID=2800819 RepID=A0ABT1A7B6_9PSEU|nr:hypothetical protein [Pseudonocardia humida]MCO1658898.1 hypothetical protein [Pseudonocardia humida]